MPIYLFLNEIYIISKISCKDCGFVLIILNWMNSCRTVFVPIGRLVNAYYMYTFIFRKKKKNRSSCRDVSYQLHVNQFASVCFCKSVVRKRSQAVSSCLNKSGAVAYISSSIFKFRAGRVLRNFSWTKRTRQRWRLNCEEECQISCWHSLFLGFFYGL